MQTTTKNIRFILILILFNWSLTSCNESAWDLHLGNENTENKTLLGVVAGKPELSVYYSLLKKTGYAQVLENPNGYTVIAPMNAAWSGVDTSNTENMTKIIGMTIVYQAYFTDNDKFYSSIKSVSGKNIFFDETNNTFNGAKLISTDIPAKNGVLHIADKLIDRKENIWNYLTTLSGYDQVDYLLGLNQKIMDTQKSVSIGVYPDGKTKYDTIWTNVNAFLKSYPLDNEDSVFTYVILQNTGFDLLLDKYYPYFKLSTTFKSDSLTRMNVCQDFVFKGDVDITKMDTLVNADGVKVPLKGAVVSESFSASNGKVYIINQSNIRLKDKIKPIRIEGEKYLSSSNSSYVFTRYKKWASGERDIVLSCSETQIDTLWRKKPLIAGGIPLRDSIASKTYSISANLLSNVANFYIEYNAKVNSANYDVYYVAYDDIPDHADPTYTSFGVYNVTQKLFASMPGSKKLSRGSSVSAAEVINNYLGNTTCFVGETKAGVHELTKLKKWSLVETTQLINAPVTAADADIMVVPQSGTMTLWLCNTARSNASSKQGLLFLDYILLVPRISE